MGLYSMYFQVLSFTMVFGCIVCGVPILSPLSQIGKPWLSLGIHYIDEASLSRCFQVQNHRGRSL